MKKSEVKEKKKGEGDHPLLSLGGRRRRAEFCCSDPGEEKKPIKKKGEEGEPTIISFNEGEKKRRGEGGMGFHFSIKGEKNGMGKERRCWKEEEWTLFHPASR